MVADFWEMSDKNLRVKRWECTLVSARGCQIKQRQNYISWNLKVYLKFLAALQVQIVLRCITVRCQPHVAQYTVL